MIPSLTGRLVYDILTELFYLSISIALLTA